MKFENTRVWGFEHALRGMRNAKNSWDRADSKYNDDIYFIGPNDMKLCQSLIRAGSEHRKFMRQIFVSVDITAPMYFWSEFDTYKVGTVANSTSKMHTIQKKPITLDCFEIDDMELQKIKDFPILDDFFFNNIERNINYLECLRQKYLETKDKRYWKELIRWLPESWLQTRTVTLNYENLLCICSKGQRRFHKLNEWSGNDNPALTNFISWARTLPYAQELIFIDELFEEETLFQESENSKKAKAFDTIVGSLRNAVIDMSIDEKSIDDFCKEIINALNL